MYLADYHVHSTCSQDGRQTMAQAAQAAVAAGMDELCLTDHVDTIYWGPEQKPRWDFDWDAVRRQFRQAQEQWGHRITLRLGAELGEAAMSFQRAEHLMQNAPPLDFVIGSVHMAPQPTPMSMGMKDLPDRPNLRNTRSRTKAIRAI